VTNKPETIYDPSRVPAFILSDGSIEYLDLTVATPDERKELAELIDRTFLKDEK
jgi:hypothetical protein